LDIRKKTSSMEAPCHVARGNAIVENPQLTSGFGPRRIHRKARVSLLTSSVSNSTHQISQGATP
jgi:hypothetical protein